MSKQEIKLEELLKDIEKVFSIVNSLEKNTPNLKKITEETNYLKNLLENKYKDLDIKE